jgi:hypothetical protein
MYKKMAKDITARNAPMEAKKLLEKAKGDDAWLDLLIEEC